MAQPTAQPNLKNAALTSRPPWDLAKIKKLNRCGLESTCKVWGIKYQSKDLKPAIRNKVIQYSNGYQRNPPPQRAPVNANNGLPLAPDGGDIQNDDNDVINGMMTMRNTFDESALMMDDQDSNALIVDEQQLLSEMENDLFGDLLNAEEELMDDVEQAQQQQELIQQEVNAVELQEEQQEEQQEDNEVDEKEEKEQKAERLKQWLKTKGFDDSLFVRWESMGWNDLGVIVTIDKKDLMEHGGCDFMTAHRLSLAFEQEKKSAGVCVILALICVFIYCFFDGNKTYFLMTMNYVSMAFMTVQCFYNPDVVSTFFMFCTH
eukprot:779506_1